MVCAGMCVLNDLGTVLGGQIPAIVVKVCGGGGGVGSLRPLCSGPLGE